MNLITKFNLTLIITFSISLTIGGIYIYQLTQDNALQQVTDQAELFMQEVLAIRSYTVNEISPLLNKNNGGIFHPQTVPAYAATQTFNIVRKSRPEYRYKEAVFNPTNPRNKATDREEILINHFIATPTLDKKVGFFKTDGKKSMYIAYPIKITNPKCLTCHSTPELAPKAMRAIYGDDGGFGWKLNEIVGTQMVVVPYKLPAELAQKTFYHFLATLALLFLAIFIVLNIILRKLVINPVTVMTKMADDLSKGNITGDEIEVLGKDEFSDLSQSFNRMRRSIIKIIQILREKQAKPKK